ncbi:MAG TPA: hypothetical protein VGO09_11590 [Flavisolibacter sp.]|nr:hypothetical protein [Flavisolibacter sp.]
MKIITLCFAFIFASCAYKVIPLKNNYSNGNFEAATNKNKEQVWDNIIDFFAKNGLSIRIID